MTTLFDLFNNDIDRDAVRRALRRVYGLDETPAENNNGKEEPSVNFTFDEKRCNVFETRDANSTVTGYAVDVVYAPFKKSDVDIQVDDKHVTIKVGSTAVDKTETTSERKAVYIGIPSDPFTVTVPFSRFIKNRGDEVDTSAVTATTNDGVVHVVLPVVHKTTTRRVPLA